MSAMTNSAPQPFARFRDGLRPRSELRSAITKACFRSEPSCVEALLRQAELPLPAATSAEAVARHLVTALRARAHASGVEGLIQEYSLSSQEGVALMCLAEALLRIPDAATRDALIRDKIASGDWKSHVGHSPSIFVNAATWGLVVTGKLTASTSETGLSASLSRLIAKGGEPLIARGTAIAMRMMGEQFVRGQTIEDALANSRKWEAGGFHYSYDMLGEAATTARDAARYLAEYEHAIHAIGSHGSGRGIYEGPGISIKLSALHPRYSRAQIGRVMGEMLPRVKHLASLAKGHDIGLNIDAEEADRLELSLDILEALALDPELGGWNGIGFVIQAYSKRCPYVIDWIVDLARRSGRRIMVRLVKGAYWDSEIKRAQVDGLEDYPVFTRKLHTDVSYLACARKLLAAPDAIFPQFATHNAQTLATVMAMAGPNFYRGQYEFQCLHGMGEPLYENVVGPGKLGRPCRIYAPVGTHETLLAYLVRRLLENGANSSFVNRIADPAVSIDELVVDPVAAVRATNPAGAPHPRIKLPRDIYGEARENSAGVDLSNEDQLAVLADGAQSSVAIAWTSVPIGSGDAGTMTPVHNPADRRDVVGHWRPAEPAEVEATLSSIADFAPQWAAVAPEERARQMRRAADAMEARMPILSGLIVREAGKSVSNAISEVREAVDFLRYYAQESVRTLGDGRRPPLGPVVCISPWNFPLAIFVGQVAAALAAGNTVAAKPAEETPLVAAEAVRLLHEAGVPQDALRLVPGAGEVGAALVADPRVMGVIFTGSTVVARLIHGTLARRLTPGGQPIPLIAETGGQNALIADSSAMAEQVVADVIASAFDSAGQRCSALRILCLQEEVADRILAMLRGAMVELVVGNPDDLATDVGPVITREARDAIDGYVAKMAERGHAVTRLPLDGRTAHGTFVAPTIIEVGRIADVEGEVFGPVLHVLRYARADLDRLISDINATGYGLTFGLHTRIDETIDRVVNRIEAGNVYINRNIIGATVGVQPFGGSGLSGTGPKAGGPLYLDRLLSLPRPAAMRGLEASAPALARAGQYAGWLRATGHHDVAERVTGYRSRSALGARVELPGPVGERNVYALRPRGRIAMLARSRDGLLTQLGAILATGNIAVVEANNPEREALDNLPADIASSVTYALDWRRSGALRGILLEGDADALLALARELASFDGPILAVQAVSAAALRAGSDYDLDRLLEECTITTNTAAAGGNASLMSIG